MRLLQTHEREKISKDEEYRTKKLASDLSNEISELTKSFNRAKSELVDKRKEIIISHEEFVNQVDKERRSLVEEVEKLREEIRVGLAPLKDKEANLMTREEKVTREEEELKEVKKVVNELKERESRLEARAKEIEQREEDFKIFRKGQEKLFNQDRQKLRDWLEVERAKIRN